MESFFLTVVLATFLAFGNSVSKNDTTTSDTGTSTNKNNSLPGNIVADTSTLKGTWYLQPVLPSDTAAGRIPTIDFDVSKHSFSGNTGCNHMSGTFQLTDSNLTFNKNVLTTKMACIGYNEEVFIKNLLGTNRYKFDKGVLVLMFDQTELSRWTRKPFRGPVTGKT